jgi:hypothetical protein
MPKDYIPTPESGKTIKGRTFAQETREMVNELEGEANTQFAALRGQVEEARDAATEARVAAAATQGNLDVHTAARTPHGATGTPTEGRIPLYGFGGTLNAGTPTEDGNAANKAYVDTTAADLTGNITTSQSTANAATEKANAAQVSADAAQATANSAETTANLAKSKATTNEGAITGLQITVNGIIADQALEQHFRGYFSTTTEIATLPNPKDGDYAYSAETGTKWAYDEDSWIDTLDAVPDQTVPASDTTPLMDGGAAAGTSEEYARGDHRHPSDTSRAPVVHTHTKDQITDLPASMPASDVSSWAKAASKPSYAISEITGARRKATANMTFYLRIDGSDSNDGTSAATAMKTFNALMNRIYKEWDFQGYNIYVNIGAGTWAGETWTVQGTKIVSYGGTFDIIGAGQGVTFVTGSDNITQGSGTGRAGMKISNIPLLYIQALTAINCKAQDLLLTNCSVSKISIELGYSWYDRVLSATEYHHGLQLFNTMANNSIEVKLTGTQYKSSLFSLHNSEVSKIVITGDAVFDVTNHLFISSSIDGTMDVDAASFAGFTGSVTGRKYILYVGSVLRGASYITPGTVAGYADASCIVV